MKRSELENQLAEQLRALDVPEWVEEYPFATSVGRKWRFDFAWLERKLAVEVEGGVYTGGRHTRGPSFEKDAEKANTAVLMGWRVLRFGPRAIASGEAAETIKSALVVGQAA